MRWRCSALLGFRLRAPLLVSSTGHPVSTRHATTSTSTEPRSNSPSLTSMISNWATPFASSLSASMGCSETLHLLHLLLWGREAGCRCRSPWVERVAGHAHHLLTWRARERPPGLLLFCFFLFFLSRFFAWMALSRGRLLPVGCTSIPTPPLC